MGLEKLAPNCYQKHMHGDGTTMFVACPNITPMKLSLTADLDAFNSKHRATININQNCTTAENSNQNEANKQIQTNLLKTAFS